jgi:hypothetical protein
MWYSLLTTLALILTTVAADYPAPVRQTDRQRCPTLPFRGRFDQVGRERDAINGISEPTFDAGKAENYG